MTISFLEAAFLLVTCGLRWPKTRVDSGDEIGHAATRYPLYFCFAQSHKGRATAILNNLGSVVWFRKSSYIFDTRPEEKFSVRFLKENRSQSSC